MAHQALQAVALIHYLQLLLQLVVEVNQVRVEHLQMAVRVLAVGMVQLQRELEYRDKEIMAVRAVAHQVIVREVAVVRVQLVATQHQ